MAEGMGRSMRLGALVVLVLSLQLSNYCSLAQPPGSSAQGNVGQGEGAGSKNGPTDSSPTPTPSPTTPTTEPSGDPSPGLGSGAPPMGPAGGKGGQLSPQEKRALAEKEALDEERNEVSEFKERYASRRHWRGFCLCSSNMFTHSPDDSFVTSCFEDLTSACFYQGFEVPLENQTDGIFSYELCHLLTTVGEGSISSDFLSLLDFEVKQKCKHPYKTRSDEFLTFFRDFIKPPPPVMELLEQRNFDGAMFSELTASEAQYIGLPLEFYTGMLSTRDYLIVSGRTVPYTEERQGPADISKVEASVQVNDVFDINEKDFTFSAAFTLSFAWTDANMWSECSGEDDELDSGECQWVWRPEPFWKNAREIDIRKKTLFYMGAYKSAFYILHVTGRFRTPMSFKKFPRDWQDLLIEFSLRPSPGSSTDTLYQNIRFTNLTAFSTSSTADADTISGWRLQRVSAEEYMEVRTHEPTFLFREASSAVWSNIEKRIERLFGTDYLLPVEYESSVTVKITVERVTSYYMLNFTLVVALLTVMSWVSFFLSPADLNDRATLSLTIILALNVFQLIMNDSMPETGYLTPLSQFIIASTFFAAFATVESVTVYIVHRRTTMREEIVTKFRGSLSSTVHPVGRQAGDEENAKDTGKAKGARDALKRAMSAERLEKFLADHMDTASIILLPVTYAVMTVVIFGFV